MDIRTEDFGKRKRYVVNLPTLGLGFVIGLSFLLSVFTRSFSGYAYSVLLAAFTVLCIFSQRLRVRKGDRLVHLWLLSVIVLVISFLLSQRSNGAFLDVIIFVCGLLLILFCPTDENVYLRCLSVIKAFAVFFAIGVLLQRFLPTLYRAVTVIFPSSYRASLLSGERSGFTSNPGYSAGYLIAGLLAVFSQHQLGSKFRLRSAFVPLLFLFALILTGKRGPFLFFVLTSIYCYLAPVRGSKKARRYFRLFLIVFVFVIMFWAFRDALSMIPVVGRVLNSVAGFFEGEDVTSGRTRLYVWAWELFTRNPILGIGWGRFRTTVVGNVTLVTSLETHNIYLQLLAETGIIGFASFLATFLVFWNTTRVAYLDFVKKQDPSSVGWRRALFFSLAYQTYFLLYGLTGNPLFDPHFQIMYIFSCMIIAAFRCTGVYRNA